MGPTNLLLILFFIWILVRVYWFFLDPRPFKRVLIWILKPTNLAMSLFDAFTAIILFFSTKYYPLPITLFDKYIIVGGLLLYGVGVIIAVWARFTMRKNWTPAGIGHDINRQTKLITNGPFKYTRNPIYLGLILMTVGLLVSVRSYFLLLALVQIIFFYRSVLKEEKLLEKYFGLDYINYKSKVPRFI